MFQLRIPVTEKRGNVKTNVYFRHFRIYADINSLLTFKMRKRGFEYKLKLHFWEHIRPGNLVSIYILFQTLVNNSILSSVG